MGQLNFLVGFNVGGLPVGHEVIVGPINNSTPVIASLDQFVDIGAIDANLNLGQVFYSTGEQGTWTVKEIIDVPEPGTLAIFGFGLAGLGYMRRRQTA